jgi:outer membrane protein OmpA-like peptidoglycan-associated protein
MIKRTLIAAIATTLTAGAVHAGENELSRPEGAGMLTGAAAGAIVGGPIGAFVGLIIGGIVGDGVSEAQQAQRRAQAVEDELLQTRRELALASQQAEQRVAPAQDTSEVVLTAMAERMHADVMFRTNSTSIEIPVRKQLAEIGKLLAAHPRLAIRLHGFADPRGDAGRNLELSLDRADTVREALMAGGAFAEQIKIAAHGEDLVTAQPDDVEAFAWERRVSLVIEPSTPSQVAQSR